MPHQPLESAIEFAPTIRILASRTTLPCIAEPQVLYLLVEVDPPPGLVGANIPLNLCLVVDRSTSMRGDRLEALKRAAGRLIDGLGDQDIFSLIAFSDRAEIVIPAEQPLNRALCRARLSAIQAGGGTEILQGLALGMREIRAKRRPSTISHLILLTDGQTYGDEMGCLLLADEARNEDIGISALGIGDDWNDTFLDALAGRTGGVSEFVQTTGSLSDFLDHRVRGLSQARSQPIQVRVRKAKATELTSAFRLEPEPQWLDHKGEAIMVGPLPAGRTGKILLEVSLQPLPSGRHTLAQFQACIGLFASKSVDVALPFGTAGLVETPPPAIYDAVHTLTLYRMHELARQEANTGHVGQATQRMALLAEQLAATGHVELAQTAQAEAYRLTTRGQLSETAAKHLKFGTRELFRRPGRARVG